MASAQEKIEAVAYWIAGSILCVTMALFGTPLWATISSINNAFHMSGTMAASNLHAVQGVPLQYYGFLVAFEVALILRTVFVVWSRGSYESNF
jgi:hypothetical protein